MFYILCLQYIRDNFDLIVRTFGVQYFPPKNLNMQKGNFDVYPLIGGTSIYRPLSYLLRSLTASLL